MQTNPTTNSSQTCDVFLSYARADKDIVAAFKSALIATGASVWSDVDRIDEFDKISEAIREGIAASKLFVAWYSPTYITRPACQWELVSVLTATSSADDVASRVLVVNPQNDFQHIQPLTLRDRHSRIAADGKPLALMELARSVVARLGTLETPIGLVPSAPTASAWGRPSLASSSAFVGRVPDLLKVHGHLWSESHPIASNQYLPHAVQVIGLPGSGKSLLVEEYAARFAPIFSGGIYWLRAGEFSESSSASPQSSVALRRDKLLGDLAEDLFGERSENPYAALGEHLAGIGKPYLWVVDDFPADARPDDLRVWTAPSRNGRTIFTSRSGHLRNMTQQACVELTELPPAAALQLLQHRVPPTNSVEEKAAAADICKTLGYHPLAIAVANGALQTRRGAAAYRSYLADLKTDIVRALELGRKLTGVLPRGYEENIVAALLLSIGRLSQEARKLFLLGTCFALAPIPTRILTRVLAHQERVDWTQARDDIEAGVAELQANSLLRLHDTQLPSIEFHALTIKVLALSSDAESQTAARQDAAATVLARDFAQAPVPSALARLNDIIVHAERLAALQSRAARVLGAYVGRFYFLRGENERALKHFAAAYEHRDRLDRGERFTKMVMHGYAQQLLAAGQVADAEALYSELLAKSRTGSPEVLTTFVERVRALGRSGKIDAAQQLASDAIKSFGNIDSKSVKRRLGSLHICRGELLLAEGRAVEAFSSARNAQLCFADLLFDGHPDRVSALYLQAKALQAMGYFGPQSGFPGAIESATAALSQVTRTWGWSHPMVPEIGSLLADCFAKGADAETALTYRWGILKKCEDAGATKSALGALRKSLGGQAPPDAGKLDEVVKFFDALTLLVSHEDIDERISRRTQEEFGLDWDLGKGNQAFWAAHNAFTQDGDRDLAVEILVEIVKHYERTRGADDERTFFAQKQLADVLSKAREHRWAWAIHEEMLEYFLEREGEDAPNTIEAAQRLVGTLEAAGEPERALVIRRRYVTRANAASSL